MSAKDWVGGCGGFAASWAKGLSFDWEALANGFAWCVEVLEVEKGLASLLACGEVAPPNS